MIGFDDLTKSQTAFNTNLSSLKSNEAGESDGDDSMKRGDGLNGSNDGGSGFEVGNLRYGQTLRRIESKSGVGNGSQERDDMSGVNDDGGDEKDCEGRVERGELELIDLKVRVFQERYLT